MDQKMIEQEHLIQRQAKEIQELRHNLEIELVLDEIRTASLSMEKSCEFTDIALQIFSQLSRFDIKALGAGFNIVHEDRETHTQYLAFSDPVTGTYTLKVNPDISLERTHLFTEAIKKLKRGQGLHKIKLEGPYLEEWIHHIAEDIDKERGKSLKQAGYTCIHVNMATFNGLSNLAVTTIEPLTPAQEYLLLKFAKAFGLPYRRFLDLEKAEEQAWEARVEAALERVRAKTMAMHESEQVGEVVRELFTQMQPFGLAQWGFAIRIALEDGSGFSNWVYTPGQQTVKQDFIIPSSGHWVLDQTWQVFKDQIQFESISVEGKDKAEVDAIVISRNNIERIPKQIQKSVTDATFVRYSCSAMKYGVLVAIDHSKSSGDVDVSILHRFAKVFEQTYTRFLDLQKAEEQAREAQIEASLERVRAAAMAMHNSKDVSDATTVMFSQLDQLGVQTIRCGVALFHEETKSMDAWASTVSASKRALQVTGKIDMTIHPLLESLYDSWKENQAEHRYNLYGKELKSYYQAIAEKSGFNLPVENMMRDQTANSFFFPNGALYAFTENPLEGENAEIFKRFAKVFTLTYRRYLDLKEAEEQAKEAKIEAALERVRARTMAMYTSSELREVVNEFFNQMNPFGLAEWGFQIRIAKEDRSGFYAWLSTPSQRILPEQYEIPNLGHWALKKYWEIFENQLPYDTIEVRDDDKRTMDQLLFRDSDLKNLPEAVKQNILSEPYVLFSVASMKYGLLEAIDVKPKGDEEVEILKRFAKVFEQTYTRFLDLQKAEAQTREAQIEAALERVRSRSMGIQKSEELGDVASMLYEGMKNLGIWDFVNCGYVEVDEKMELQHCWMTRLDGSPVEKFFIPLKGDPILDARYKKWKDQAPLFHQEVSGTQLANHLAYVTPTMGVEEAIEITINEFPDPINFYCGFFKYGYLCIITGANFSEEQKEIIIRFTTVFKQAYIRFIDLKKAEKLALETARQSALDRIRAEIASMRSAEDLQQITPIIWDELKTLEIPFIRCGVFIIDEENGISHTYLSTPQGESIAVLRLPLQGNSLTENATEAWKKQRQYSEHWNKDHFQQWTRALIEQGHITSIEEYTAGAAPETLHLHFIPFKQGMLYIGNTDPLSKDNLDLAQSMANSFSVAYDRYEDFKKLEEAKEKIEQAFSELEAAQAQLIHSEKMASLGELTAGIAHEIQNPLNFVNNFSEVAGELIEEIEEEIENNDLETVAELLRELIENLQKIHHHGERASGIVRGMLDHSRAHSDEKTLTDINQLCDEYLRLAYHGMRARDNSFQASFHLEADSDLPKVIVVSQDIGRVFLNLINNGFQAIMERSKKESREFKPTLSVKTAKLKNTIQIEVVDNGLGIPAEVRDKIFQPFFTTKPTGEGTGLGLSLAYDIIKAHGGSIHVESTPAVETKFTITLPDRST